MNRWMTKEFRAIAHKYDTSSDDFNARVILEKSLKSFLYLGVHSNLNNVLIAYHLTRTEAEAVRDHITAMLENPDLRD